MFLGGDFVPQRGGDDPVEFHSEVFQAYNQDIFGEMPESIKREIMALR